MKQDELKRKVAFYACENFVSSGMNIGLGSGSTSELFIEALGEKVSNGLQVVCCSSSERSSSLAAKLNITVRDIDELDHIDLAVDGADEIDNRLNLTKGGGACLLREKIVARKADLFLVIADHTKLVSNLGGFPLPVEVCIYGHRTTIELMSNLFNDFGFHNIEFILREKSGNPLLTDNGNFIVDITGGKYIFPEEICRELNQIPGVVENGIFADGLCKKALVAEKDGNIKVLSV